MNSLLTGESGNLAVWKSQPVSGSRETRSSPLAPLPVWLDSPPSAPGVPSDGWTYWMELSASGSGVLDSLQDPLLAAKDDMLSGIHCTSVPQYISICQ